MQAMPKVLQHFPQAQLALAGDGQLREQLEAEARILGILHAVRFLGYRNDVPDLLQAADLFVMPSHLEGLCSTLIDAMFAKVPIVATTAGGIPEILDGAPGEQPVATLVAPPTRAAGQCDHQCVIRPARANRNDQACGSEGPAVLHGPAHGRKHVGSLSRTAQSPMHGT